MDDFEVNNGKEIVKKTWNPPAFFSLNTKKTEGGTPAGTDEDDPYALTPGS